MAAIKNSQSVADVAPAEFVAFCIAEVLATWVAVPLLLLEVLLLLPPQPAAINATAAAPIVISTAKRFIDAPLLSRLLVSDTGAGRRRFKMNRMRLSDVSRAMAPRNHGACTCGLRRTRTCRRSKRCVWADCLRMWWRRSAASILCSERSTDKALRNCRTE